MSSLPNRRLTPAPYLVEADFPHGGVPRGATSWTWIIRAMPSSMVTPHNKLIKVMEPFPIQIDLVVHQLAETNNAILKVSLRDTSTRRCEAPEQQAEDWRRCFYFRVCRSTSSSAQWSDWSIACAFNADDLPVGCPHKVLDNNTLDTWYDVEIVMNLREIFIQIPAARAEEEETPTTKRAR